MRTRRLIIGLLVSLSLLLFTACAPTPAPAPQAAPQQPQATPPPAQPAQAAPQPAQPAQAAPKAEPFDVLVGATSQTSATFGYYAGFVKAVETAFPELKVTILPQVGGAQNLINLREGTTHLGTVQNTTVYTAYHGIGAQAGQPPFKELRALFPVRPSPFQFVVRTNAGIKSVQDLHGVRFAPGATGTGTNQEVKQILEALGTVPKYFEGTWGESLDAFKDRQIDAMIRTGTPPDAGLVEASLTTDLTILSLTDADFKKMQETLPWFGPVVIPKERYSFLTGDVVTTGILAALDATTALPEEVAYKLTKGMWENFHMIVETLPELEGTNMPQLAVTGFLSPLHKGAIRYYEELGLTIPPALRAND